MNNQKISWFWRLLKESYEELIDNDPLRLGSSTAFFAVFAIIPIILLPLNILGIIFSEKVLKEQIFGTLQKLFGKETTEYLSTILSNIQSMQEGPLLTVGIVIFLIFVATTLFHVIHNSFNQILQVKLKSNASLAFTLKKRVLSLFIILIGGLFFFITFTFDVALSFMGDRINLIWDLDTTILKIVSILLSMSILTVWLSIIYKYLPDIQISWKPVWFGALFTAVLFVIGQYILGEVLALGSLNNIYGASASMVLILLFIFYSSFILYYGFCIMKKYADLKDYDLNASEFSVRYKIKEYDN